MCLITNFLIYLKKVFKSYNTMQTQNQTKYYLCPQGNFNLARELKQVIITQNWLLDVL